ncbi:5945_t:CDS:10, partial [Cetraspora pellucida]
YEYNIATISSFYPNAYKYYDNVNTSSSPYPGPYEYDSAMSTYINFQSSSDVLTESDFEAQLEGADNGIYDERENNKHEDSENEEEEKNNLLVLCKGMKFSTWELAELYLTNYAKQEGFSFRKRRWIIHEPEKAILAEDRRDRDSKMIDCSWHINLTFPKTVKEVCINSILDLPTQYNLLVASFPGHIINRKDLSNAIQQFKSQAKLSKNDASSAIIEDKTESTFTWVLQKLKNSCEIAPIVLYSDADSALLSAKLKGTLHEQFRPFHTRFLEMRNTLCHKKFESKWENLINEYPACKSYLMNSTQQAEVTNKIIKDKLNRTSQLTDVVREIQTIFDQQSKKAVLAEYKNEIPTKDQIAQSICYDAVLVENWLALLEEEMAREDDYDQPQSLFPSLLEDISQDYEAFVPMYQIKQMESNELPQLLSFQHLVRFKQTSNVVQSHGPKQRYRFGMEYAKKPLDLAIHANKVDDFVNEIERFIEKLRGICRQPKRYKSGSELLKKITGNKKEGRHCQKCRQTGHYAP